MSRFVMNSWCSNPKNLLKRGYLDRSLEISAGSARIMLSKGMVRFELTLNFWGNILQLEGFYAKYSNKQQNASKDMN